MGMERSGWSRKIWEVKVIECGDGLGMAVSEREACPAGRGKFVVGVVGIHTLVVEESSGPAWPSPCLLKPDNCHVLRAFTVHLRSSHSSAQNPLMASHCPESNMKL